jgi:hypothetical protein
VPADFTEGSAFSSAPLASAAGVGSTELPANH